MKFLMTHVRVILIGIACIFVIGITLGVQHRNKVRSLAQNQGPTVEQSTIDPNITLLEAVEEDTDEDGVLDWEELLWGTDPKNPMTNKGILDSAFIASEKKKQSAGKDPTTENDKELSSTDKLAREILVTTTTLNQAGTFNEAALGNITASFETLLENEGTPITYSFSDLKLSSKSDYETVNTYAGVVVQMIGKYPISHQSLLQFLLQAASEENGEAEVDEYFTVSSEEKSRIEDTKRKVFITSPESKDGINGLIRAYEGRVALLKGVTVPLSAATIHLKLLNAHQEMLDRLKGITALEEDALSAYVSYSTLPDSIDKLDSSFLDLKKYFTMVQSGNTP